MAFPVLANLHSASFPDEFVRDQIQLYRKRWMLHLIEEYKKQGELTMATWNKAKQAQLDSLQQEYNQWCISDLPAIQSKLTQLLIMPVAEDDAINIITNAGEIISYLNQFKSK